MRWLRVTLEWNGWMFTLVAAGWGLGSTLITIGSIVAGIIALVLVAVFMKWGSYWVQAYMSGAHISMASLIAMSFLKIEHRLIVTARIMAHQAGLPRASLDSMSASRLQAHHLAGGHVMNVVQAIITAHRAGIDLDFDRATAIDLAGRNVLDAVQTSVSPMVIHCPPNDGKGPRTLSAVAKNGVELRVAARVTVRTNLDQLIGGATEETIVARVGQGIITAIGSAESHMDVLERPSQISENAVLNGLDANTAFAIVSIDISDIDVGQNIGARLQTDQANADTRIARAKAEVRRADAVAREQQMKARVTESRAEYVLAEAEVPAALSEAFRAGRLRSAKSDKSGRAKHPALLPPVPKPPTAGRTCQE